MSRPPKQTSQECLHASQCPAATAVAHVESRTSPSLKEQSGGHAFLVRLPIPVYIELKPGGSYHDMQSTQTQKSEIRDSRGGEVPPRKSCMTLSFKEPVGIDRRTVEGYCPSEYNLLHRSESDPEFLHCRGAENPPASFAVRTKLFLHTLVGGIFFVKNIA